MHSNYLYNDDNHNKRKSKLSESIVSSELKLSLSHEMDLSTQHVSLRLRNDE